MARKVRDKALDSREARSKLPVRGKCYWRVIEHGLHLGYRRLKGKAGTWWARHYLGDQQYETEAIGIADDISDADGVKVLTFWQAQDMARQRDTVRARAAAGVQDPMTVTAALDRYAGDLETREADAWNAKRVRMHVSEELAGKLVRELNADDLKVWRERLRKKKLSRASINRIGNAFRAALNGAADAEKIADRSAWRVALKSLPDATESRNVILSDSKVLALIAEAYRESDEFGLLIELAALTGARFSQLARIEVQDLQADRIMMPSSRKGRGAKKVIRRPVPIIEDLAVRLRRFVANRRATEPLLMKPDGGPWQKSNQNNPYRRAADRAGLDPEATMYALRHSSIVRQIKAGVPIRVVAVNHDTSVLMIERTYSKHINDHTDALTRPTLLDTTSAVRPAADNVVPMEARQ